jgi:hypothetical protein
VIAVPTVADLKAYARIEHVAEDALLAQLIARAVSHFEVLCDLPLNARAFTWTDDPTGPGTNSGPMPATRYGRALLLPHRGLAVQSVTDGDGATVPTASYRVDGRAGMVFALEGTMWANGPYTVAYTAGMDLLPDAAGLAPAIQAAILDIAADFYQRRTASATSETAGQSSANWTDKAVLQRVAPIAGRIKLAAHA